MKISKQAKRQAKEWFRECLVQGKFDENRARQAVQRVIQTKPRGHLAILLHLQRLIQLEIAKRTARIETAAPIAPDQQTSVLNSLSRIYGAGLYTSFVHNPNLIGGMRIQVGSDVYDGSVAARLESLEETLS